MTPAPAAPVPSIPAPAPAPWQAQPPYAAGQWPAAGVAYPSAQAGGTAQAAGMRFPVLPMIGVGALVLGMLLPWAKAGTGSFDLPVNALWDISAEDMFLKVGMVLVAIAVLGALVVLTGKAAPLRRMLGGLGAAVGLAFMVQAYRAISDFGGGVGDVFKLLGAGVYVTVVAGVLMTLGK